MRFLILGLLLGLTACNEVMAPISEPETVGTPTGWATSETEVLQSEWEAAADSILAEIDRRGWHFVREVRCFEQMSWFSQWVASGYVESAQVAVTSWEETQSEGDPDYACIITEH